MTTEKYLSLAKQAVYLTKYRMWYNDTYYSEDDLINECFLYGNWRKYENYTDKKIVTFMAYFMIQYLSITEKFGHECKTQSRKGQTRKSKALPRMASVVSLEDVTINNTNTKTPYELCAREDFVKNILSKIDNPEFRYRFVLKTIGGYNNCEIGRKEGKTGQAIRNSNKWCKKKLRKVI